MKRKKKTRSPGPVWKSKGKSKIHAIRETYDNVTYDSQTEAAYAKRLEVYKKSGLIQDYKHHPEPIILLSGNDEKITWKVDFLVTDSTYNQFYIETKGNYQRIGGLDMREYRLKLKIWKIQQENLLPLLVLVGQKCNGEWNFKPVENICMEKIDYIDK